jgi:hypothetical protein
MRRNWLSRLAIYEFTPTKDNAKRSVENGVTPDA